MHAAHVLGTRSRPVLCNACHTSVATQIHKTGVVTAGTVVLANLSTTGGIATAAYAGAGGTCSNTYCHGNLGGGIGATNVTPTWKTAATLVCNSCHGMPPAIDVDGPVPPEPDRLRRLPRRLHRHDGQRGDPRERRDRVHDPDLHHLPR